MKSTSFAARLQNMNMEMKIRFIFFIITVINALLIIVFTVAPILETYGPFIQITNFVVTLIFIVEYIWNIIIAKKKVKYIFSISGIIQVLSIVPFAAIELQGVRLLKVIVGFALYRELSNRPKEEKYEEEFLSIIKKERGLLLWSLFSVFLIILASAFIIFSVEHPLQPQVFRNPIDAIWWAFQTVSTVGYGDIVPISLPGRVLAMALSVVGIATFSIPTTLISTRYIQQNRNNNIKKELQQALTDNKEISIISNLERLQKLLDQKTITNDEFNDLKAKVIKKRN
ncbi:potassium channel family protein [Culicoidibacter larvae]|uniref:Potassium channel family protein n=1 Tax=Culicoidibacter larvae TaxID=2579976 RepID=A0A5R8QEA0_9FIRM|nr:potassium channel family protein [Culicoidibacter larvae]TLG74323.1 potassium channel family protein [Culicoidibacter larvae]